MPFITRTFTLEGDTMPALLGAHDANPVSYTHLTLPTNREV